MWGEKIKCFFEIVMGVICVVKVDFKFDEDDYGNVFMWCFFNVGYLLFNWYLFNGYLDICFVWVLMFLMVMFWSLCNWMVQVNDKSGNKYIDIIGQILGNVCMLIEFVDFWIDWFFD